jgi:hypothetical protein
MSKIPVSTEGTLKKESVESVDTTDVAGPSGESGQSRRSDASVSDVLDSGSDSVGSDLSVSIAEPQADGIAPEMAMTTASLLPARYRTLYADAKKLLEESTTNTGKRVKKVDSLTSINQVVLDGIEQDEQLAKDKLGKALGKVKLVAKAGDVVDTGLGKAADLFEAAGVMDEFCTVCSDAPGFRALKAVTGVVDGARAVRKVQLAGHGTQKLAEQLATSRKLEIVGRFTDNQDLIMVSERNQMVDDFLKTVLEKAKKGQELETFKSALDTASGACMIAGIVSGNPGALTASTALGITTTAIKGVEIIVEEGKIKYYKKKRLTADDKLVVGAYNKWKAIAEVGEFNLTPGEDAADLQVGEEVQTKEFTNSIWYKEDLAKLIVARFRQRPRNKVYGRILELFGEEPDVFTPEKFNRLSRAQKKKLVESIEDKLSGRDKTVKGVIKGTKTTIKTARETIPDLFEEYRNVIRAKIHRLEFKEYSAITNKTLELMELAEKTGVDPRELTIGLFDKTIDQGGDGIRALRQLLHFSGVPRKGEVKGTNQSGRLKARLLLLEAIREHLEENPEDTVEAACEQVDEEIDVFAMARNLSLAPETISPKVELLRELAIARGLNAALLVDETIQEAIDAGPATAEALHHLLKFRVWPAAKDMVGTSAASRLGARLVILEELKGLQDRHRDFTMEELINFLSRNLNKAELARGLYAQERSAAKE